MYSTIHAVKQVTVVKFKQETVSESTVRYWLFLNQTVNARLRNTILMTTNCRVVRHFKTENPSCQERRSQAALWHASVMCPVK